MTNQVRGGDHGWQPVGGPAIAHACDVILALESREGPWRRLTLEKHPFAPAGSAWELRMEEAGLV